MVPGIRLEKNLIVGIFPSNFRCDRVSVKVAFGKRKHQTALTHLLTIRMRRLLPKGTEINIGGQPVDKATPNKSSADRRLGSLKCPNEAARSR
jgi:hypothetical protein